MRNSHEISIHPRHGFHSLIGRSIDPLSLAMTRCFDSGAELDQADGCPAHRTTGSGNDQPGKRERQRAMEATRRFPPPPLPHGPLPQNGPFVVRWLVVALVDARLRAEREMERELPATGQPWPGRVRTD